MPGRVRNSLWAMLIPLILTACHTSDYVDSGFTVMEPWDEVHLSLSFHAVNYAAGTTAEVTGQILVTNSESGEPRGGRNVSLYVMDPQVEIVCPNPTTGNDGTVSFVLRTRESGGRIAVAASTGLYCYEDCDGIMFSRQDRQPAQLQCSASPDTIYVDAVHADSALIQIAVLDAQSQPVPNYTVECPLLTCWSWSIDCDFCLAQTDLAGKITDYHVVRTTVSPWTWRYPVHAGALTDTVFLTVMPWDSAHGG